MKLPHDPRGASTTAEAVSAGRRLVLVSKGAVEPSGALTARFAARAGGVLVRRFVVRGPESSQARVYAGEPGPFNLADGTRSGSLDVADYAQPLYVPPSVALVVVWTNRDTDANIADPLGVSLVRAEIEEM